MHPMVETFMENKNASDEELRHFLFDEDPLLREELFAAARQVRHEHYGHDVFVRGLIEVSNICRNDCYYCGIRRSNRAAERYHLSDEEILVCCAVGYELGIRTFVMQGGEDPGFHDLRLASLIRKIKEEYPDCAVTLSLGERSEEVYQLLFEAGADRYLLRHETIVEEHYRQLHPNSLSLSHRIRCLEQLKAIGYQVGCGMMVGSPYQKPEYLLEDLRFLQRFRPHMVGIGPFLPHHDTPFAAEPPGSSELTLRLLAVIRIMLPLVLLPATTALATAAEDGREAGILAGANVVMPNLSPPGVRKKYMLYDNKRSFGKEAAEGMAMLKSSMEKIGYTVVCSRGDCLYH